LEREIFVRAATERRQGPDVEAPFAFQEEDQMRKLLLAAAATCAIAAPALADDVGVRVGPVGAGVTVGEGHDRDRVQDRTVIRRDEPRDRTTVIKKEDSDGNRSKTVIHHDD
jgi:hypothetical protein